MFLSWCICLIFKRNTSFVYHTQTNFGFLEIEGLEQMGGRLHVAGWFVLSNGVCNVEQLKTCFKEVRFKIFAPKKSCSFLMTCIFWRSGQPFSGDVFRTQIWHAVSKHWITSCEPYKLIIHLAKTNIFTLKSNKGKCFMILSQKTFELYLKSGEISFLKFHKLQCNSMYFHWNSMHLLWKGPVLELTSELIAARTSHPGHQTPLTHGEGALFPPRTSPFVFYDLPLCLLDRIFPPLKN